MKKKRTTIILIAVVAVIGLVILANSFTVVDPGQTGVVVRLGAVSQNILSEGLHIKAPFITQIRRVNNQTQMVNADCSASSKDLQSITSTVVVNYHVNKDASASLYQTVGLNYETKLIAPAIQESVKSVTAKFTAEELIIKRAEVSEQIRSALSEKIDRYGFTIEALNIVDFSFSEEFDRAIEAKQTAQQQALKAEQDLARIKFEAEQEIVKAEAEAEALRIKKEQINEQMLQLEFIQRWDGKMPIVMGAEGNIMDISGIINSAAAENAQNTQETTSPPAQTEETE